MPSRIDQLKADLGVAVKAASDIVAASEAEARDFTADERAVVTKAMTDAAALKAKLIEAKGDQDLAASLREIGATVGFDTTPETKTTPGTGEKAPAERLGTIGERFTKSDNYAALLANFPNGRVGEKARVGMSSVEYKTLITGLDSAQAGALITNDYRGILDPGTIMRPLTIKDLITIGSTTSDTIEYVRVLTFTNAAAPVAEALTAVAVGGAAGGSIGTVDATEAGVKPESAMTMEKVTETVRTLAHWIPITRRALSDASQIRTIVDSFLRYGLEEELEDQIIGGSGSGENFTGIGNTTNVQAQAWSTDILETTRKARTLVKTVGRAVPTAYVMNPTDWETIDLLQDNEARYFFGGPARLGQPTLWGLPVVESEAVPAGTAYVGDWRQAILWDREQASITVSDSHADFFIRNLIAILAEMRAAFGVVRPKAFVEIDVAA